MAAIDRRNIQEQNQDTKGRIRAVALSFRSDPLRFSWLIETLQAKSLSPENGILASLSHVPEQSGELYRGLWLTRNHELFEFAVLLPRSGEELEIESWRKVTAEATVREHQPGTGKSFGFLALEVLSETQES